MLMAWMSVMEFYRRLINLSSGKLSSGRAPVILFLLPCILFSCGRVLLVSSSRLHTWLAMKNNVSTFGPLKIGSDWSLFPFAKMICSCLCSKLSRQAKLVSSLRLTSNTDSEPSEREGRLFRQLFCRFSSFRFSSDYKRPSLID